MFISPAVTRFQNEPYPADDQSGAPPGGASTNPLEGPAIDFEHFSLGSLPAGIDLEHFSLGSLANGKGAPSALRPDPIGEQSDGKSDCVKTCAKDGAIGGAIGGGAAGAIAGAPGGVVGVVAGAIEGASTGAAKGWGLGSLFGEFWCDDDSKSSTPASQPEDPKPASPPPDDPGQVGGYETANGAGYSSASPTDPVSTSPGQGTPDSGSSTGTSDAGTSDSSSNSSSSSDGGRVGGTSGEGDMPADDSYGYSVNPRLANFGMVSAVEIALAESLLNTSSKSTQSNVASLGPLGIGLRG